MLLAAAYAVVYVSMSSILEGRLLQSFLRDESARRCTERRKVGIDASA